MSNPFSRWTHVRSATSVRAATLRLGTACVPFSAGETLRQVAGGNEERLRYQPSDGYYLTLFAVKTLQQRKVVLALAFDYPFGVRCADWESGVEVLLAHPAFRPMDLPRMGLAGPTYLNLKIQKVKWQSSSEPGAARAAVMDQHIAHIVLQGHNGDHNMSVEQNLWYPEGVTTQCDDFRFVLAVFQGLRVILLDHDGRLYAAGPARSVAQLGTPRMRLEVRGVPN